ncbi:MAG: hypothetical protein KME32_10210 [Mojavia pulchra JT2-VF2]|jgi:hypothetical protein|uniref:Uncharacterized protein n=1 Tax=Mojavia pulchra JT2-VF2 TaxID=287848 RepID=A0A951PWC2_9NOST|nr:hypothetical protein [Mojavia pulchra JT2-VF2]
MIAEMQLDELRLAIEQPAAHHVVVFETGLAPDIPSTILCRRAQSNQVLI